MGKTPAELDKALEQGKVTLDDFLGFSKHLFKNYGKNAEILASSPAAAGDRLATEFSKLKENFGGLFANIGANVQDFTTKIFKFFNDNEEQVKETLKNIGNFVIERDDNMEFFARSKYINCAPFTQNSFEITPLTGFLFLLPSWVYHSVELNKEKHDRISLAFNFVPQDPEGFYHMKKDE